MRQKLFSFHYLFSGLVLKHWKKINEFRVENRVLDRMSNLLLEVEEAVDKILNYSAMLVWITKGFYSGKQSVFFRFTKAIYHYKRIKEHFSLKVR